MPRFSANLSMLFTEVDFLERFNKAAGAGFEAVEFLFPYAWEAEQLVDVLNRYGLRQVLHNLPAGNWEAGERGIAGLPDRVDELKNPAASCRESSTVRIFDLIFIFAR